MRKRATSAAVGQDTHRAGRFPTEGGQRPFQLSQVETSFSVRLTDTLTSLFLRLALTWAVLFGSAVVVFYSPPPSSFDYVSAILSRSTYPPNVAFAIMTLVMIVWSCLRVRRVRLSPLRWILPGLPGLTAPVVLIAIARMYDWKGLGPMPALGPASHIQALRIHGATVPHFSDLDFERTGDMFPLFILWPWAIPALDWRIFPGIFFLPGAFLWCPTAMACFRADHFSINLLGIHGYALIAAASVMLLGAALMEPQVPFPDINLLASEAAFFPRASMAALVRAMIIILITATTVEAARLLGTWDDPLAASRRASEAAPGARFHVNEGEDEE